MNAPFNPPAYPSVRSSSAKQRPDVVEHEGPSGMTLCDYFAAKALVAVIRHPNSDGLGPEDIADIAYAFAEAMLQRRTFTTHTEATA